MWKYRDHVCKSILKGTDACSSGSIVKPSALYNWSRITTVPRRSGIWELEPIGGTNEWFSSPLKNSHLGHHTVVGHLLPRTGTLPSINTGGESDSCSLSKIQTTKVCFTNPDFNPCVTLILLLLNSFFSNSVDSAWVKVVTLKEKGKLNPNNK